MKVLYKLCLAAGAAALLAACATTQEEAPPADQVQEPVPAERTMPVAPQRPAAETMPAPADQGFQGSPLDDPESLLSKRVIYFEFDRAEIGAEFRDIVDAHADYLASNRNVRIVLEGHTDERGSREYNLGLGERRANSVRSMLTLQGVSPQQIEVVSYGEERPVAMGQSEESWRLNRRVEIVYR